MEQVHLGCRRLRMHVGGGGWQARWDITAAIPDCAGLGGRRSGGSVAVGVVAGYTVADIFLVVVIVVGLW